MEIRILKPEEYMEAVQVAHGVFDYCLRQHITDRQLIDGFRAYANEPALCRMAEEGRLTLWGVFEENRIVGMSAMQSEGHITMLYVYSAFQRRGFGSSLIEEMRRYAATKYGLRMVTLNALPAWTSDFFAKRGFRPVKLEPGTQLPFVPMQTRVSSPYRTYEKKPIPGGVVVGTSIAGLVLCFLVAIGFMASYLW
jgi:ribosomal protein S18 acetylase RimI-like enzyme